MNRIKVLGLTSVSCLLSGVFAAGSSASAQGTLKAPTLSTSTTAGDAKGPDTGAVADIIVTARKRSESELRVPVTISAVGGEELTRRGVNTLEGIARIVPQLIVGTSLSVQGGSVALRGIGASGSNPFADQAVSFSVDGAQVARASIVNLAQVDVAQVEVLKGPQALFFGKNSPAGIVVIKTADPSNHFEAKASGGYEFVGHEVRGDGYISGPLTDTLGARLTVYGSSLRGYVLNIAPSDPVTGPARLNLPNDSEIGGRLTLKFDPSDSFSARLKVNYSDHRSAGLSSNNQLFICSLGAPQLGGVNDCKIDDRIARADPGRGIGALAAPVDAQAAEGKPYLRQNQILGSLEMNVKVATDVTLASNTSYYRSHFFWFDNVNNTSAAPFLLAAYNGLQLKEISQELRLTSNFSGPVNFLIGGQYQDSKLGNQIVIGFRANNPLLAGQNTLRQEGKAYSAFGQLIWNVSPEFELSGGGRYSHEEKSFFATGFGAPIVTAVPNRTFNNFSPEITAAWRPNATLTLYGTYKKGFLSGGFNAGVGDFRGDRSFGQENVRAFEVGLKTLALNGKLRTNISLYDYVVDGLQVSSFNPVTLNQNITNAGRSTSRGAEIDMAFRAAPGLNFTGALAYNHARYNVFPAPCYTGQTVALGCNGVLNPATGAFTSQNLAGAQVVRAPDWSAKLGFDYEHPLSAGLTIGLSSNISYSSRYFTDGTNRPGTQQPSYALLDGTLRVAREDGRWELALVGRNLTDKQYFSTSNDVPFTGLASATGTSGFTVLPDVTAVISRGREVWLRATVKY